MSTRKFAPLETEIWNLIGWQSQRGWLCWIETYWFKKKTTRLAVLARNLQEKKYPRKRRSETEAVRRANAAGCVCSKPTRRKMYPRTRRSETEAVRRANAAGCVESYKLKQNGHPRKRRSETEALGRANAAGCVGSKTYGFTKNTKRNCTLGNGDRKRLAEPMRLAVMARNLHDVTCGVKKSKSLILKRVGSDQHIFIKLFRANAGWLCWLETYIWSPGGLKKNVGSKQTCATGIF